MIINGNLARYNSINIYKPTAEDSRAKTSSLNEAELFSKTSEQESPKLSEVSVNFTNSDRVHRKVNGLTRETHKEQAELSRNQAAESSLFKVSKVLNRITELTAKAADSGIDVSDRLAIEQEITQLVTKINSINKESGKDANNFLTGVDGPILGADGMPISIDFSDYSLDNEASLDALSVSVNKASENITLAKNQIEDKNNKLINSILSGNMEQIEKTTEIDISDSISRILNAPIEAMQAQMNQSNANVLYLLQM